MSDLTSSSSSPAGSSAGLAPAPSFADTAPAGSVGPSAPTRDLPGSSASSAPSAGLPGDPQAPVDWKKRYDDTKAAYTQAQEALKEFGDLGTAKQRLAFVEQLQQDPGFLQWAAARLQQQQAPQQQFDPETIKALQLVRAMIHHENAQLNGPLYQRAAEQHRDRVFGEMDSTFGADWAQFKPQILALHQKNLQQGRSDDFDTEYLAGLYRTVRAQDPQWVAQEHERWLRQKHANVTAANPGTAPAAVGAPPVNSVRDAFRQAKRQHGVA